MINGLRRYLKSQITEIQDDPVLRIFGACLSTILALTAAHWIYRTNQNWLAQGTEAICWPMFENCRIAHAFSAPVWFGIFLAFGLASFVPIFLFLRPASTFTAYGTLLALNLVKTAIILVDYRMRLNQHIMALFITLVFLFVPGKRVGLRLMIILFYFWAGILKLDPEWLSGSALYVKPWFFTGSGLAVASIYVVVLELVFVWALLFDRSRVAWATFAQLIVFHVFSFPIVGFFYPLLCFAMLAIFPLIWTRDPSGPTLAREILSRKITGGAIALLCVFSFFQVLPKFFPGDTALTGEGRLLALHMFDSITTCDSEATIRMKGGMKITQPLYSPMSLRIHCDPVVYLARAREICHRNRSNQTFVDLDLVLTSRRSNETASKTILNLPDFCARRLSYSFLSTNDWIQK